jgi:RND family efflux transporter MFP subunit
LSAVGIGCNKSPEPLATDPHDHGAGAAHEDGHVTLSKGAQEVAGIETTSVRLQSIQATLDVPGTVVSTNLGRAVVTPPVAGRISSIAVQLGEVVLRGQVLATLESPELAQSWSTIAEAVRSREAAVAAHRQAEAELALAQAKVVASRENLKRQKEFVRAGAFSQAPVQQARNELNQAQSDLLSVQKEQTSHADQLRRLENLFREGIVSKSELESARLELQQDQIRLDRARAQIDNAKATYDREQNIANRGLLNAKELQVAEADLRANELEERRARIHLGSAAASVASAARAIENAKAIYRSNTGSGAASVGRAELVAPISGTVTHLDVTRGQAVDRTQTILEIEDLESVWVTASIPERSAALVRKGAPVSVTLASHPGEVFSGVVQVVGSRIDPKTRSIPAQCLISKAAGRLKPDMFATVSLTVGSISRGLVIPKSAVITEGEKSFAFVKEGDKFEKRELAIGRGLPDFVNVASGLKEGELVASKGAFVLSSEQKKDELKGHDH